jgi:hypothetical protein
MSDSLQEREPYQHYYKLSDQDISRRLASKRMSDISRQRLHAVILEGKAAYKSRQASEKRRANLWRDFLAPVKYELKMCRSMLRTTKNQVLSGYYADEAEGQARVFALEAYIECITGWVIIRAMRLRADNETPSSSAKKSTKRFPHGMPNNGVHWVDWIPQSIKQEITLLFDAIPHRAKAKRKIPFERKVHGITRIDQGEELSMFEEQRYLLRKRTERALEKTEMLARVDPTKYADDMDNIKQALLWIDEAKEGELLPSTWHGFF